MNVNLLHSNQRHVSANVQSVSSLTNLDHNSPHLSSTYIIPQK